MAFGPARLAAELAKLDPAWRDAAYCVALSGGMDSAALLHAMRALAAAGEIRTLRALHVDHGIQAQSPYWSEHCRALCAGLSVPFSTLRLHLGSAPGASLEAAAREARYAAFAGELQAAEWLLTAHHRDDQLETVLIQLLRGAGVAGLAAMPACAALGAGWHGRPLLGVDRAEIEAYVRSQLLPYLRDPMNDSSRFDRGWLRGEMLPRLRARWPALAATVGRSAAHLAQASRLLAELAAADAAAIVEGQGLSVAGLLSLSHDRQANLLRWWIRECGLSAPPAARLAAALVELPHARADALPLVRWPGGELRRYRSRIYALRPLPPMPEAVPAAAGGEATVDLGSGCGRFRLVAGSGAGIRLPLPQPVEVRFRAGGEGLRPHARRPRKRLKDLCQEAGIVPWLRERLPLVYAGGRLVAVADLWVDAEFQAAPGEAALVPQWDGRPPLN